MGALKKTRWWQAKRPGDGCILLSLSRCLLPPSKRLDFDVSAYEMDKFTIVESRIRCACLSAARIHKGIGKKSRAKKRAFSRRQEEQAQDDENE